MSRDGVLYHSVVKDKSQKGLASDTFFSERRSVTSGGGLDPWSGVGHSHVNRLSHHWPSVYCCSAKT